MSETRTPPGMSPGLADRAGKELDGEGIADVARSGRKGDVGHGGAHEKNVRVEKGGFCLLRTLL